MIFDLEKILKPTEKQPPCGPYLFYEQVYDTIQQERKEEDATLPQGVWERELKKADWQKVFSTCTETLESESKDIQIAAWATEAAIMLYGVHGLCEGMTLLRRLSEKFWSDIHPVLGENDQEYRYAPLEWCDAAFSRCLLRTQINIPRSFQETACSWADWVDAEHHEKLQKQLKGKSNVSVGNARQTLANIFDAVDATPAEFYLELAEGFRKAQDEIRMLFVFLEEKQAKLAPTFSILRKQIDEMQHVVKKWLKERKGINTNTDTVQETILKTDQTDPMDSQENHSMVQNKMAEDRLDTTNELMQRDKAYALLKEAAEILDKCEPHSPVPHLVRRLISWKNKSLDELMAELSQRGLDLSILQKLFQDIS